MYLFLELFKKDDFTKISKNLTRYRFENNLDHQNNCVEQRNVYSTYTHICMYIYIHIFVQANYTHV